MAIPTIICILVLGLGPPIAKSEKIPPPYTGASVFQKGVAYSDVHNIGLGDGGFRYSLTNHPSDPVNGKLVHAGIARTKLGIWPSGVSAKSRFGLTAEEALRIPISVSDGNRYSVIVRGRFLDSYPVPSAPDFAGVVSYGANLLFSHDASNTVSVIYAEFRGIAGKVGIKPSCLQIQQGGTEFLESAIVDLFLELLGDTSVGFLFTICDLFVPIETCAAESFTISFEADLPAGTHNLYVGFISEIISYSYNALIIGQGGHATELRGFLAVDEIELVPILDDCEPNEAPADSCVLGGLTTPLELPNLNIATGDVDWFRFSTIQAGGPGDFVSIEFSNSAGNLDMCLYQANPSNPSNPTFLVCAQGNGDGETIELDGRAGASYLVKVFGRSAATNPDYTLTIVPPGGCQVGADLSLGTIQWDDIGADYDGCPECGEHVKAVVELCSSQDVSYVEATLVGGDCVSITDGDAYYGSVSRGDCAGGGDFAMNVTACSGSRLCSFAVHAEYQKGGRLYCQDLFFNRLFREACSFDFQACETTVTVVPENDCDKDGVLDSGEKAEIRASIRNTGNGPALNVDVWLSCPDGLELDCGPTQDRRYPDLAPGACEWPEQSTSHWDLSVPRDVTGTFYADMNVLYKGAPGPSVIPDAISFSVQARSWIAVEPREKDLGVLGTTASTPIAATVRNTGTAPMMVTEIEIVKPAGMNVTVAPPLPWQAIPAQSGKDVTITVTAAGYRGPITPTIEVIFKSDACSRPERSEDRVRISGLVSDEPARFEVPYVGPADAPDISGDWIVWLESRDSRYDIFAYNIRTGEERRVTAPPAKPSGPLVSGTLVVWNDTRDWNGVKPINVDVYASHLGFSPSAGFPVTATGWDERLLGVDGDFIAVTQGYEYLTSGNGSVEVARNLLVYKRSLFPSRFTLHFTTGFAPGSGYQPRPTVSEGSRFYNGDFGSGLLVFNRYNWVWNATYSRWEMSGTGSDQHVEVIDLPDGPLARRAFDNFAYLYVSGSHEFFYVKDDTEGDEQLWRWRATSGTSEQLTTSTYHPGADCLAHGNETGASFLVYDYGSASSRPGLYSMDLLHGNAESTVRLDGHPGEARMDGDTVVWVDYNAGNRLFFSYLDGPECTGGAGCDDGNPCTVDTCVNGLCSHAPVCSSDAQCSDGIACNGAERCDASGCCLPGTPPDCDDGVGCTQDTCTEPLGACQHVPVQALCDDGLYCTGVETCDAVQGCQPGTPVNCDDAIACTDDFCVEATRSCQNVARHTRCDNGVFCDGTETCDAVEGCVSGDAPCPEFKKCRESDDRCVTCLSDAECNDNLYCDGVERCNPQGNCEAGLGNPCDVPLPACNEIDDVCVECLAGADCPPARPFCSETTNVCVECSRDQDCDQTVFCDGVESCIDGTCIQGGPPCIDGNHCDEQNRVCICVVDEECDDGLFCNGIERCDKRCKPGPYPCGTLGCNDAKDICVCDSDDDCSTPAESCRVGACRSETCVVVLAPDGHSCDDGLFCTVSEACVQGICTNGVPRDCNDGLFCNGQETCANGACIPGSGSPPNCDDGNSCTSDSCNEDSDTCVHSGIPCCPGPCPTCPNGVCDGDETQCTCAQDCGQPLAHEVPGQTCADGKDNDCDSKADCQDTDCAADPSCTCDDGNPCTNDALVNGVCQHTAVRNGTPCPNGLYCDGNETCQAGVCTDGPNPCPAGRTCDESTDTCSCDPPDCDDGNACTRDTCEDGECEHAPVECEDGQVCDAETGECGIGPQCVPCAPNEDCADDGNLCTIESCSATGCCETAFVECGSAQRCRPGTGLCVDCLNDADCDDASLCTIDACVDDRCAYTPVECPVGQTCDRDTGDCVVCVGNSSCDDGLFCNGQETCVDGTCQEGTDPCGANQRCDEDVDECRPICSGGTAGPCGLFGSVCLIALPLYMFLWMGVRGYSRRRG